MMATTAVLVRVEDRRELIERTVIAGFLAGYAGHTLTGYTTDLRLFTAWCVEHGVGLLDVKRPHLELFARSMEASGRMPATVARRRSTLCGFCRYCHDEGLLVRNPATHVRRPKVDPESRTLGLDRNEFGALLVQAGLGSPRDHALISLLALNGLRISEALGADIDDADVDRGHRTLRILHKGGKHAVIPLARAPPERSTPTSATGRWDRSSSGSTGGGWTATPPIAP
jgi:site-specific recombinase XerD